MRIITGSAKGTKLKTPSGMDVRPTADRVKESLFNILGTVVMDAAVLDLFAGTGNLGLEALSRGAESAVFVDKSPASLALVKANLRLTHLEDHAVLRKGDVLQVLDWLTQEQSRFGLVFCDPPYNQGHVGRVLAKLGSSNLLLPGATVVMEHSRHEPVPEAVGLLHRRRTERYGETLISLLSPVE